MIMSGHPFIKALAAYWGGAFVQGLRCHFISMPGKSPMKLEVTFRHDHSCLLGRKASKQTNKIYSSSVAVQPGWSKTPKTGRSRDPAQLLQDKTMMLHPVTFPFIQNHGEFVS